MKRHTGQGLGRVPSAGASVPMELGRVNFPCGCGHQPGSSQIPYYWDFMEVSSHVYDPLLTPVPAPLLSGGWRWS